MTNRYVTSSSLIKEFELDGHHFRVLNVVRHRTYTFFAVELKVNGKWILEYETSVSNYPDMSWADVMRFIKSRAGAEKRLEKFLDDIKGQS